MTTNSLFLRSLKLAFTTGNHWRRHRSSRRNGVTTPLPCAVEVVEERCLLSAVGISPAYMGSSGGGNPSQGRLNPLTSIPDLKSHPGAPVNIYLDFDGHTEAQDWPDSREDGQTGPIVTPVFDVDDDFPIYPFVTHSCVEPDSVHV